MSKPSFTFKFRGTKKQLKELRSFNKGKVFVITNDKKIFEVTPASYPLVYDGKDVPLVIRLKISISNIKNTTNEKEQKGKSSKSKTMATVGKKPGGRTKKSSNK